jgi:transcriptional regulator with XRE-family HTH domain
MTAAEFRAALETLGKSQADLAREFDVWPETVNRWATGKVDVPGRTAAYLNLLLTQEER